MTGRATPTELVLMGAAGAALPMPAVAIAVLHRTPNASFAADEFFKASISNEHTRRAYGRIVARFLVWCIARKLEVHSITPGLAGEYISQLEGSAPTKNQALALRHLKSPDHLRSVVSSSFPTRILKPGQGFAKRIRERFKSWGAPRLEAAVA